MLDLPGRKWSLLFSAALTSLFLTTSVFAQVSSIPDSQSNTGLGGGNSIIGTVFDPSGQPLQRRVQIRLSTMTRGDRISTTGDNGSFAFRGLPPGTYTITIDKEAEFKPQSQNVDIIQFRDSPGQTYTLNIRLQFKDSDVKTGVISAEFAKVPKKALALYNEGMEQAKNGNYQGAIEQFNLAIVEHPSFKAAFNEMGVLYLRLNQPENADEAFQKVLKLDPVSSTALINRGIANFMMKRYGEVVPILRKALKKNEKSAVGHYFMGQALANLGLFDEAEKELLVSLDLGKEQMKEAHRILAIIYTDRGAKKEAADQLEAYLKLTPDAPDADKIKEMIARLRSSN